jgi:sugar phosphate permease
MNRGNKLFYGWWIVVVLTVMTFSWGTSPLSIVLKQLMEQFQTGRGAVSLGQTISSLAGGITGVIVGRLVYRYRPRTFMLYGSAVSGLSQLALGFATNLGYFYVFNFITGVATGCTGAIVMFSLLSKWFSRKWGSAVGITQTGVAIGSLVLRPLAGLLVENFGWQSAYFFAGGLLLVINVPLILFVLKDSPQPMGLFPDGEKPKEIAGTSIPGVATHTPTGPTKVVENNSFSSVLKSPALWLICLGFAFTSFGYCVVSTHEVSFITDMNISATVAATAFGLTFGISGISSLASGWLADKLSSRYVSILFALIVIAGMLVLLQADTMSKIWLFVVIFGLGIGAFGTLLPIVTRDVFGSARFSAFFGFTNVIYVIGFAAGAPLAGFIFDATGSYHMVFVIVIAIYILAILGIYFAFGASPKPFLRAIGPK